MSVENKPGVGAAIPESEVSGELTEPVVDREVDVRVIIPKNHPDEYKGHSVPPLKRGTGDRELGDETRRAASLSAKEHIIDIPNKSKRKKRR